MGLPGHTSRYAPELPRPLCCLPKSAFVDWCGEVPPKRASIYTIVLGPRALASIPESCPGEGGPKEIPTTLLDTGACSAPPCRSRSWWQLPSLTGSVSFYGLRAFERIHVRPPCVPGMCRLAGRMGAFQSWSMRVRSECTHVGWTLPVAVGENPASFPHPSTSHHSMWPGQAGWWVTGNTTITWSPEGRKLGDFTHQAPGPHT